MKYSALVGSILQETEFYILNYNIEEFLSPEILERFGSVLEQVFQNPGAGITEIVHPATRGIPLQSPTAKHGLAIVNLTLTSLACSLSDNILAIFPVSPIA